MENLADWHVACHIIPFQAAGHCCSWGGKLFEPMNQSEDLAVKAMMPNTYYWIGIEDLVVEGQ